VRELAIIQIESVHSNMKLGYGHTEPNEQQIEIAVYTYK